MAKGRGGSSALSKNQRQTLEKRVKAIESDIASLEDTAAKLSLEMATPKIAANFEKLNLIAEKHRQTEKKIQELYAEWENAVDSLK